jgi:hypothetical protein
MNHIQTDVSDEALVTAIRLNMCDFFRHLSRSSPAENLANEQFTRWFTPLPHPWFNGVLSSNLPDDDVNHSLPAPKHTSARRCSFLTWWLEPRLKPSQWEPVLTGQGFEFQTIRHGG